MTNGNFDESVVNFNYALNSVIFIFLTFISTSEKLFLTFYLHGIIEVTSKWIFLQMGNGKS